MSKCEYENKDKCTLNECMYGDFLDEDDSRFHTGKYCLCDAVEKYEENPCDTCYKFDEEDGCCKASVCIYSEPNEYF